MDRLQRLNRQAAGQTDGRTDGQHVFVPVICHMFSTYNLEAFCEFEFQPKLAPSINLGIHMGQPWRKVTKSVSKGKALKSSQQLACQHGQSGGIGCQVMLDSGWCQMVSCVRR